MNLNNSNIYILRHKDYDVAVVAFNDDGEVMSAKVIDPARMPFQTTNDNRFVALWWNDRAIPEGRFRLTGLLERQGCSSPTEFLIKNLGLSLTDSYWICPYEYRDLKFEDVNLFDNAGERIGFHEAKGRQHYSGSPNAALGGSLDKDAFKNDGKWFIRKKFNTKYPDAQQNANELFVSELNKRLGWQEYTPYTVEQDNKNRCVHSFCEYFTNKDRELITAYDLTNTIPASTGIDPQGDLEQYIKKCVGGGLDYEYVRKSLDYMISLDFVISNSDRHWNNFGVLRDPETLKLVSVAPLFDHGNSMFFDSPYILRRINLVSMETVGIAKLEQDRLAMIQDRNVINNELLPSPREVADFYAKHGLSEERAMQISRTYSNKLDMFLEFQHGFTISVAHEMEMLGGITPYVDQKPNPEYFEKHPEADRNLVVPNILQMEQTWNAFFVKPEEEKKAHPIEWEGKTYSLSVFEDKYLSECQKAGAAPDKTILKHFKEVCVDMCGYKPKFYKEKQKDISHKQ